MAVTSRSQAKVVAASTTRQTRSSGAVAAVANAPAPPAANPPRKKAKSSSDIENKKPASTSTSARRKVSGAMKRGPSSKNGKEKSAIAKATVVNEPEEDEESHCVCLGSDDGTPMIRCEGECLKWYHFRCISLSETDAEQISFFICPECGSKSGMRTIMDWEGPEAFEKIDFADKVEIVKKEVIFKEEDDKAEDSPEEDDGSEDEYVAQSGSKRLKSARRSARRVSLSSDQSMSNSDISDGVPSKRIVRRGSKANVQHSRNAGSPILESALKRKNSSAQPPASKRAKSSDDLTAQGDPVRKYCLGKLDEVIRAIFLEYPLVKSKDAVENDREIEVKGGEGAVLTDEEKQTVEQNASAFVAELEECLYHTYSETDKGGRPTAGGKYKERFRMLNFNLGKSDRVILRRGIASGRITPSQISVMSSTDLANEQTKQEIHTAEQDSLEHSILKKMTAPRAKITHKGFEDIEDVNGMSQRDSERRNEEEEERMERDRLARMRSVIQTQALQNVQGESSASPGMSESPSVMKTPSWGRPPALPMHVLQQHSGHVSAASPMINAPPARPLFIPSASDMMIPIDGGLNLADLINIDGDSPPRDILPASPALQGDNAPESESTTAPASEMMPPSGPSPFAPSKPSPVRPSFDLSSIWTGNSEDGTGDRDTVQSPPAEENRDNVMDIDGLGDEADDHDFDMFLDQDDKGLEAPGLPHAQTDPLPEPTIEDLPHVWTGAIAMPFESLTPLAPSVVASQIGGRALGDDSPLWQIVLPSAEARIDGRVPVDKSSHYLLNTRLNVSKELIAVCFTPQSESEPSKFNELVDYLVGKERHALVFPWGMHPKPSAPGRELYIIPLLQDQAIPEYIEMLDDLRLPKIRTANILLGVFVLNKGKLIAPPVPPEVVMSKTTLPQPPLPLPSASPLPSNLFNQAQNIIPPPVNVSPSVLAAEVASLTPEQISLMLRHFSQTTPAIQPIPPPPIPSIPPLSISPFPPTGLQPQYQPPPPVQPHPSPPPGQYGPPTFDNYDRGNYARRSSYGRDDRDHGGRGGRSRGTDRGRGGGRGRPPQSGDYNRPRRDSDSRFPDSGWASRGRADGPSRSSPQGRSTRFGESNHQWN